MLFFSLSLALGLVHGLADLRTALKGRTASRFGLIMADEPISFLLREEALEAEDVKIEDELDWRDYQGQNWLTYTHNQHSPVYCGACWAFSTTSALGDRINIRRGNVFPQLTVAPQPLLDCDNFNWGCHGGDASYAYEFMRLYGTTDETCAPYVANGHDTGRQCVRHGGETGAQGGSPVSSFCATCDKEKCWSVPDSDFTLYRVKEHGQVSGEEAIMRELNNGPIACAMAVTDEFLDHDGKSIFMEPKNKKRTSERDIDHLLSLVGYGTDQKTGQKYWVGRNSWGTFWSDKGFFLIGRGTNELQIEKYCYFAEPDMDSLERLEGVAWVNAWSEDVKSEEAVNDVIEGDTHSKKGATLSAFTLKSEPSPRPNDCCGLLTTKEYTLPDHKFNEYAKISTLEADEIPKRFSWHNVDGGVDLLTASFNQHMPVYCGSCWAFSVTSMLSDRLNIARYRKGKSLFPQVNLSPQHLINEKSAGTCLGGNPGMALYVINQKGIVDETCQPYQAKNKISKEAQNECFTCEGDWPELTPGTCYKVDDYKKWWVGNFGRIAGAQAMKKEIYENGPITCGMHVSEDFWNYESGIYSEALPKGAWANHAVEVVGWGYEKALDKEYWIVRNSWGNPFGELSYFRLQMHTDNLLIEDGCWYGVPVEEEPDRTLNLKKVVANHMLVGLF